MKGERPTRRLIVFSILTIALPYVYQLYTKYITGIGKDKLHLRDNEILEMGWK